MRHIAIIIVVVMLLAACGSPGITQEDREYATKYVGLVRNIAELARSDREVYDLTVFGFEAGYDTVAECQETAKRLQDNAQHVLGIISDIVAPTGLGTETDQALAGAHRTLIDALEQRASAWQYLYEWLDSQDPDLKRLLDSDLIRSTSGIRDTMQVINDVAEKLGD